MGYPAIPNYMDIAQQQGLYNLGLAHTQSRLNNPNQYTPFGSRTTTYNPDGTSRVDTALSPEMQQQWQNYNDLTQGVQDQSKALLNDGLSYDGVPAMPDASQSDRDQMTDAVYGQQTRFLDPQFSQGQSDLDSKLANQGIMPGSEAYDREMNNFNLRKTAAYGDARDRAIQSGGAEQSRLYDLGLKSRVQGVNEQTALHNSKFNDLASVRGNNQFVMPTFQGTTGTNIGNIDLMNAANLGYQGSLGNANADAANSANFNSGLFGLGSALIQNPGIVSGAWNWLTG